MTFDKDDVGGIGRMEMLDWLMRLSMEKSVKKKRIFDRENEFQRLKNLKADLRLMETDFRSAAILTICRGRLIRFSRSHTSC